MAGDLTCDWTNQQRLRKRPRKSYCYLDEEEEGDRGMALSYSYSIHEKMRDERYSSDKGLVEHFESGKEFSVQYLQATDFSQPMIFHSPDGLGMKMPPKSFTVADVKNLIGPSRMVDVMDCCSQEALHMQLDQFCQYYENHSQGGGDNRLLNVISLEFSHTRLDPMVEAPKAVRELDWVNLAWPSELRARQTDPTNDMRRMMYPKVQKYCLMSVAGCYTDFHLDFGGTSVWYHVLKGEKVFFLVPPSQGHYYCFREWQRHGQQEKTFFPDLAEKCGVLHLKEGDTLLLPSGWIHGVYTPKQSLVFGGNFLNSFHIIQQLEVAYMEKQLRVQERFCYPYFNQIHWYVISKYNQHLSEIAASKESELKHNFRGEDFSYPPGKWVESVSIPKFPANQFRLGTSSSEREALSLPYLSQHERAELLSLIQKMKGGLFASDKPGYVKDSIGLLNNIENHLNHKSLWHPRPNGITVLGMHIPKEEAGRNLPVKLEERAGEEEYKKHQGDCEVFDIIEEFFGSEAKEGVRIDNNGIGHVATQPIIPPLPKSVQPSVPAIPNVPSLNNGRVTQLVDHMTEHQNEQQDNSKLIDELMQSTFGEKSESSHMTQSDDHMTKLLSELTGDHMMQFLTPTTSEKRIVKETTSHVTTVSSHMTQSGSVLPPLSTDHMSQLLDHVTLLAGLTNIPAMNRTNIEDGSLSKLVEPSLTLLSPSAHQPFTTFTTIPSTATPTTPSVPSLVTPPNTLPLNNQIDRNLLSSIISSKSTPPLHSIGQASTSSSFHTLLPTPPAPPSSLSITPVSSGNVDMSVTTPTASDQPSMIHVPVKETGRRPSKTQSSRKPRNGSKGVRKQGSRKSRCGKCEGCKRSPCGECKFCLDSVRMGGFGKLKKACIQRRCTNMVEPRNSITLDSPSEILGYQESSLSKREPTQEVKTDEVGGSIGSVNTPTLDNNPMVEVLSMGFVNSGLDSSGSEELVLPPESFGLSVTDDLHTSPLVAENPIGSNSGESPMMRINDSFCSEDPLFNASIPPIQAHVLSSPASNQLSTTDLFPFSSHTSMSDSDFALHLTEDNV